MSVLKRRGFRTAAATLASAALVVGTPALASAHDHHGDHGHGHKGHHGKEQDQRLEPRSHFTMEPDGSSGLTEGGEGIPNIDSVKSTIRTYYNATDGIADKAESPYISELDGLTHTWARRLAHTCEQADSRHHGHARHQQNRRHGQHGQHGKPAIVLDADDTTLWTYDMEDNAMGFNFDPPLQNTWVQEQRFPATPHMDRVVRSAEKHGCTIIGLTGRNDDQKTATIENLNKFYGGAFDPDLYFTKWTGNGDSQQPGYIHCATDKCTTVEYKAGTRRHIEKHLGYDIVASFGDQFSDLKGGYADHTIKMPNPTYYLP